MAVDAFDITIVLGEQWITVFELQDANGSPQDITGHTVAFALGPNVDADPTLSLTGVDQGDGQPTGGLDVIGLQGQITVKLDADVTRPLTGPLVWSLWLDPAQPNADAVLAGAVKLVKVVNPT